MARRLETTHSGSYVALSSRVAPVVPGEGAGRIDGIGSRREPGWPTDADPDAARGTDHLRTPRTAGGSETRGLPHSDPREGDRRSRNRRNARPADGERPSRQLAWARCATRRPPGSTSSTTCTDTAWPTRI